MGHNDLGEFYYQLGDLPAALKSFAQARDYCTTDKHIIEMCLNVSKVKAERVLLLRYTFGIRSVGMLTLLCFNRMETTGRPPHAQLCPRDQLPDQARASRHHADRPHVSLYVFRA